jgi:hypothetical protein
MFNGDLLSELALDRIDQIQHEADAHHLAGVGYAASDPPTQRGFVERARRAVAAPLHAVADAIYPRECLG